MLHAHGGLVGERSALEYARTAVPWWKDQGIYPVYFVWETSAFEVIKQRLGIRGLGDCATGCSRRSPAGPPPGPGAT